MKAQRTRWSRSRWLLPAALTAGALSLSIALAPSPAEAFCGFYVAGADTKLFNNATMVVLMREGTRTVLSMQNNYQGPPENFAMVVPVPVVLQKENVKTLPRAVFDHIDKLAAPRLVEYWEQDPCSPLPDRRYEAVSAGPMRAAAAAAGGGLGVKIEAQFTVGEYEVVVLSARDSLGLDTWLRQNKYKIPDAAEPLLRPYVQSGMKFFVAKVDTSKVTFENGMAMLSPLRFYYDTDTFSLPVRLGLVNSAGTQDLIVHILARGQRYEVANYKNVTIPTNLDVEEKARGEFGAFYAALFDKTLEEHPGSVVTEYAWDASTCDPCPTPALDDSEIATFGADAMASSGEPTPPGGAAPAWGGRNRMSPQGFVITRIHARYGKASLGEDLVFRAATSIVGGREVRSGPGEGKLETGAGQGGYNNFQARYAIRHPWTGPIKCEHPTRGVWGAPPEGVTGNTMPMPAQNLAFAPRGTVKLAAFLKQDVPEIKTKGDSAPVDPAQKPATKSCGACFVGANEATGGKEALVALAIAAAAVTARRRRSP